ncbi:hypothetical protein B0H17DRAFT_1208913 [Mycena rosella]|uniref:Uncharacterized protein n=1 Tax=Mycena rosella TaxID=1033263 RepID=A0AAD7D117_MYCRO|nr:hypothetical protein B0H17DRAFT_1208913 [Mycena rosella]
MTINVVMHMGITDASIFLVLSDATNLQKIRSIIMATDRRISPDAFELLIRTPGPSLRELSNHFQGHSTISMSIFGHLTEVQALELWADSITFVSDLTLANSMDKLHTLDIGELPSMHTLRLSGYFINHDIPAVTKLLNAHKDNIIHLSINYTPIEALRIYNICKNLVDCEFNMPDYDVANLTCERPHESLTTVMADNLTGDPETIDLTMFPVLRKIQIRSQHWPATEYACPHYTLVLPTSLPSQARYL